MRALFMWPRRSTSLPVFVFVLSSECVFASVLFSKRTPSVHLLTLASQGNHGKGLPRSFRMRLVFERRQREISDVGGVCV
ncbi:hypothetical protein IE53DRAFT_41628 [Violaceomyces palustris]|uniref:Uncharacterized protein n=1 Tax=Violaceomyces palustris TaxID=1673888 RepID=A0ACD0P0P8_9BASI|nr:hypothetical protein IE53DRAFT_41628 [Violaceomyces palustris]